MTPDQKPQQSSRPLCGLRRRVDPVCNGPAEVQIRDQAGTTAWGCVTHAASALAVIRGSTIVAHSRDAAAIEAHRRAEAIKTERGWALAV
jgi:hypothetical protein